MFLNNGMKNLELMTLESAFFACLAFLTENWGKILSIVGPLLTFISVYYSRKRKKQSDRDRERPAILELAMFCIVPLKEWLKGQKNYHSEELNLQMLLGRSIENAGKSLKQNQLPDDGWLQQKFTSLLEKFKLKERWDKVVKEYSEICEKLNNKEEKLNENLEEEVSEEEFKKSWRESKYVGTYDQFKVSLFNDFQSLLEGKLLDSVWWRYVGQDKFDSLKEKAKDHINEINHLVEDKSRIVSNLEDLLEEVIGKLEQDYNLTPSELRPAIELSEGEAKFIIFSILTVVRSIN